MKIRQGFVSNSSSSSFICDVCNETYSGYDLSFRDCEIMECENGHIVCLEHLDVEVLDSEEFREEYGDDSRCVPAKFCPCCSLKFIMSNKVLSYILKKYDMKYDDIKDEIRILFKTEKELINYIKN